MKVYTCLWAAILALSLSLTLACNGSNRKAAPSPAPVLSLAKDTFNIQEKITLSLVDGHQPPHDKDWVGVFEETAVPDAQTPAIWRGYLKDLGITWSWGQCHFDPATIDPSQKARYKGNQRYKIILAYDDGYAVASSVAFATVAPPALSLSSAKVAITDPIQITLANGNNPPGATDWIALYPAGSGPASYIWYAYLKDLSISSGDGTFTFDPSKLNASGKAAYLPGQSYTFALLFNDSYKVEASATFTTRPQLSVSNPQPSPTDLLTVTLKGGNNPPGAKDWIGLYVEGTGPSAYLWYGYLKDLGITAGDGTFTFNPATLTPGDYVSGKNYQFVLFYNDSYTVESTTTFAVK